MRALFSRIVVAFLIGVGLTSLLFAQENEEQAIRVLRQAKLDGLRENPDGTWAITLYPYKLGDDELSVLFRRLEPGPSPDEVLDALNGVTIDTLDISQTSIDDSQFARLRLPHVKHLILDVDGRAIKDHRPFTAESLDRLTTMPKLQNLSLGYCSDDALSKLQSLSELRSLSVHVKVYTGRGIGHLARLKNLQTLDLRQSLIDDDALREIATITSLERLDLASSKISDAGLVHLQKLPKLKSLRLHSVNTIIGEGLRHLKGVPTLRELELDMTQLGDPDLLELASACPDLESLNMRHTLTTDVGVAHLSSMHLKHLDISNNRKTITNASLQSLSKMVSLEQLNVELTLVDDAGLEHLKSLVNLRELNLEYTWVTRAGVATLQESLKMTRIKASPRS